MKILILAHGLNAAGGKSVGMNIISSLSRIGKLHTYLFVIPDHVDYLTLGFPPNRQILSFTGKGPISRLYFDLMMLPLKVKSFAPDIIWGLGNMGMRNPPCPQAILYHKPQLVYPKHQRPGETLKKRLINKLIAAHIRASLCKTQLVFCQTEVMARKFRETFNYKGTLNLMPNAISQSVSFDGKNEDYLIPPEIDKSDKRTKLFCLTRYYAHKNIEIIVECFKRYREVLDNVVCYITIESSQHPGAKKILSRIQAERLEDKIINIGPLPQERIGAFYIHTDGLLLPTLLESFSGTYLEAMAFGRPILTSKLDFAKEICGKGAIYFDPWCTESLRDAILNLENNKKLREDTINAATNQRKKYLLDWDDIVLRSMSSLEMIAENK